MSERQALRRQKEGLLELIRSLDFEHETGKIPDEEYAKQREQLLHEAAAVLKMLDKLAPAAGNGATPDAAVERDIEAAIAALRQAKDDPRPQGGRRASQPVAAGANAEIEAAVQSVRRAPTPATPQAGAGYCPNCGKARDAADKFCAYCGNPLA